MDRRHLVSSCIDLIPTFCDYAGVPTPEGLPGLSLRPLAEGRKPRQWRQELVTQTEFCTFNKSYGVHGRLLRMGDWKYVVYSEGANREQLFDVAKDRGEMNNLAGQGSHRRQLAACRERLAAVCHKYTDDFPLVS